MASSQQFANRQYGASTQQQGSAPVRNNKQMFAQTMAPAAQREKRDRNHQQQEPKQPKLTLHDLTDEQKDEINEAVSVLQSSSGEQRLTYDLVWSL